MTALLRRANAGPQDQQKPKLSKRDRRVAARTRAVSAPGGKQDEPESGNPAPPDTTPGRSQDAPLAKVIPMPVFDPFAEADKPW